MLQLTIDAIEAVFQNKTDLEVFQHGYIIVASLFWIVSKQIFGLFSSNSGRIVGLMHAISTVLIGIPVLLLLVEKSFSYEDMFDSFNTNYHEIRSLCNIVCYASIGYFLMDSYFLVKKTYLKHHIGAIVAWLVTANHHQTSVVHGTVAIALFELGAILVQLSRVFPNVIAFRFFICSGYTGTRLALTWYYGFILYSCIQFWSTISFVIQIGYVPIFTALLFLLVLNMKWTFLQWKAFVKVLRADGTDFYSYHQKIIGNSN